jgi:hypothetical protein
MSRGVDIADVAVDQDAVDARTMHAVTPLRLSSISR